MFSHLTALHPNSAKVYLILLSLLDPSKDVPLVRLPIPQLAGLSDLSPRACSRAIKQLTDLRLLANASRGRWSPRSYLILPPPSPSPDHPPTQADDLPSSDHPPIQSDETFTTPLSPACTGG